MSIAVFKKALRGLFGTHASDTEEPQEGADRAYQHTVVWEIPADANAAANIADEYFWTADKACDVKSAFFLPDTATDLSSGTNYGVLNLKSADGAGGSASVAANASTAAASANFAVGVPWALTVQSAAVAAGGVLAFGVTKAASGVDMPTGKLVLRVDYTG